MYCLARDCARDEVVRKFVEPALELVMLNKALRGEFDREMALLIFGEMYATAVAGDGTVGGGVSCWPSVGSWAVSRASAPSHVAPAQPAPARRTEVRRTDVRGVGQILLRSRPR